MIFKFNNLALALGVAMKFYISVAKGLKLKVRKFWRLISTFVEVTRKKTGRRGELPPPPPSWIGLKEDLICINNSNSYQYDRGINFWRVFWKNPVVMSLNILVTHCKIQLYLHKNCQRSITYTNFNQRIHYFLLFTLLWPASDSKNFSKSFSLSFNHFSWKTTNYDEQNFRWISDIIKIFMKKCF